jgi:GR25 family glycosyltransferase involved in LPS biosynthesis
MKTNIATWDDIYTVVINLEREQGRRAFMEHELKRLGIPHVFLNAIDGRSYDFTEVYDETRAKKYHGCPLGLAEKGCALSHRIALGEFLQSGKQYGLIMEDDIAIDASFTERVTKLVEDPMKKWTYLQFNYSPLGWQGVALWWFLVLQDPSNRGIIGWVLLPFKAIVANSLSLMWGIRDTWHRMRKTSGIYKAVRDHYLGGCYLITREAAKALIELNTPLTYTADRIQNIARRRERIHHYLYVPRIVRQKRESFSSSINNQHFGKEVISY